MSRLFAWIDRRNWAENSINTNSINQIQTTRFRLVFNGRLFNRQALLAKTADFPRTTDSDAEIVLTLFTTYGAGIFADLEGYWSLIIIDEAEKQIIAARDHFGNKPLYYLQTDDCVGVSSEIYQLCSQNEKAKEINKNAVIEFLLWGDLAKHNQHFFTNIHDIPPSHYLLYSFDNQELTLNSYYELPYKRCKAGYNPYEEPLYIDNVRQLVLDSVRENIGNQQHLAVSLSGGMDSSSILCSAVKVNPDCKYTAFTFGSAYDNRDRSWAEKVVKHTGVEWVNVSFRAEEMLDDIPQLNKIQGVPIFHTSTYAQYKVMQAIKERGFDAVLDGQGGDELFGGYNMYFPPFWYSLFAQWFFKDWLAELFHMKNADFNLKDASTLILKNFAKKHFFTPETLAKRIKQQELSFLNKELTDSYFHSPTLSTDNEHEVLNDYLYESYTRFLSHILRWGSSTAGSFGMDCLMPFSNSKKMAEYVFSLPSTFKIHHGWGKYLLRSAMVGIVPDEVRWRKQKLGFHVPEETWLQEIGKGMKQRIADLPDADGLIDKTALLNQWDSLYNSRNFHFQQFVFRYYSYLAFSYELRVRLNSQKC